MENFVKFAFSVQSTGKKAAKTTEPELYLTTTNGKVKINEATSRLLGVAPGDHLMFMNNADAVSKAILAGETDEDTPVTWGIAKGNLIYGKDGKVEQVIKRLSKAEKEALIEAGEVDEEGNPLTQYTDKLAGFKLASVSGNVGIGSILEGSDAVNWVELGGNNDEIQVYSVSKEPVQVEAPNGTESPEAVDLFVISLDRSEAKR